MQAGGLCALTLIPGLEAHVRLLPSPRPCFLERLVPMTPASHRARKSTVSANTQAATDLRLPGGTRKPNFLGGSHES